jgi:type VI secretion system secreted protein Hcp
MKRSLAILSVMVALAAPLQASAAIYMNVPSVTGESTLEGLQDWIELQSFQWGIAAAVSRGNGASRESGTPQIGDVTITKVFDSASLPLMNLLLQGTMQDLVKIDFVSLRTGKPFKYLEYSFSKVVFSGYSISSGGDRPSESLSLNFTKFKAEYFVQNDKGNVGSVNSVVYDLAQLAAGQASAPDEAPAPVPEPTTWAMLGGGLLLLGWRIRRTERAGV